MQNYRLIRATALFLLSWLVSLYVSGAAESANMVHNGSFEVGMGKWIGWEEGERESPTYWQISTKKTDLISTNEHHLGRQSFEWSWPGRLRNQYMKLDTTKKHTISFYAKANGDAEWVSVALDSSYRFGDGGGDGQSSELKQFQIGREWKRYEGTVTLPQSRNGYYKLWLVHQGPGTVWVDGVQVEEGESATEYSPASSAEIGLTTGRETSSNLFFKGETTAVRALFSVSGASREVTVNYTVYDYRNRKITEFDRSVALDDEGYGEDNLKLDLDYKGLMSLMATISASGRQLGQEELVFGLVSPPRPPSADDDSPIGVHVMGEWPIGVAEKLGIRWQRMHDWFDRDGSLFWIDVETEDGKFAFRDRGIDRYLNHHMGVFGVFWSTDIPKWALNEKTAKRTDLPRLDKYRRFVREMVSHYKGRIKYWEVWNEPYSHHWWSDTPEAYFELLKATYEEAKKIDPECKIVGGNQASLDYGTVRNFTTRLFDCGGLDYMDIFSIHALGGYMMPDGPTMPEELVPWTGAGKTAANVYRDISNLMASYGKVLPIWNTETDVWCEPFSRLYPWVDDTPWNWSYPPMPPDLGADYLVQATVVSMANNCPKSFFYVFQGDNGRAVEDLNQTLLAWDLSLKSTAVACSQFLLELGHAKFAKQLDWGDVGRCYLFGTPEGSVAVAWGLRGWKTPGALHLPASAAKLTWLDVMGNPRKDLGKSAYECRLPLGSEPVYIRAKDIRTLENVLSKARISGLIPHKVDKILAAEPELKGKVQYAGQKNLGAGLDAYALSHGDGSLVVVISARRDIPVFLMNRAEKGIKVTLPGKADDVVRRTGRDLAFEVGETPVIVRSDGRSALELLSVVSKAKITGISDLDVEGVWTTSEDRKLYLSMRLKNMGGSNMSPAVEVKELPAGIRTEKKRVVASALKPDKSTQIDIEIDHSDRPRTVVGEAQLTISGSGEAKHVTAPLGLAYSLRIEQPVKVDGDLSEWSSEGSWFIDRKEQLVSGQDKWTGAEDLSASVRSRWNDEFVFLALEVKDDYLSRREDPGQLFNGTSIEVFVDSNQREDLGRRFYDRDDFHIIFAPGTPDKMEDAFLIAPYSGMTHVHGLAVKSRRSADGYTMEIALPKEMFTVDMQPGVLKARYEAGLSIGLSMAVNDSSKDSAARESSIMWSGTAMNYRDPSKLGTVVLLP